MLGLAGQKLRDGVNAFARDPVGATLKGATIYLALAARVTAARPLPSQAASTEPLPGAELDATRTRWARPGFEQTFDPFGDPTPAAGARAAVLAKRRDAATFEPKGPDAGGLGRRR